MTLIHMPFGGWHEISRVPAGEMIKLLQGVGRTLEQIRYERLKGQLLQGLNPEVNTDRAALVSRMEQMAFRQEIVTALDELDRKIMAAGTPLDFKACVDLARTIYEEVAEDAAKRVAAVTGDPLPLGQRVSFGPWKDLLVKAKVLTSDEGDLYQMRFHRPGNIDKGRWRHA